MTSRKGLLTPLASWVDVVSKQDTNSPEIKARETIRTLSKAFLMPYTLTLVVFVSKTLGEGRYVGGRGRDLS